MFFVIVCRMLSDRVLGGVAMSGLFSLFCGLFIGFFLVAFLCGVVVRCSRTGHGSF